MVLIVNIFLYCISNFINQIIKTLPKMKKLLLAFIVGLLFASMNYGQSFQFKADDIDIDYKNTP